MTEYAFDVKLWALARVQADNEGDAQCKLAEVVNCLDIPYDIDGVLLTEASSEGRFDLVEVDGEAV